MLAALCLLISVLPCPNLPIAAWYRVSAFTGSVLQREPLGLLLITEPHTIVWNCQQAHNCVHMCMRLQCSTAVASMTLVRIL